MNKVLRAKQVKQLYAQGESIKAIARQLGLSRTTTRKYADGVPEEVCKYHRTVDCEAEFGLAAYKEFVIGELTARKKLAVIYRQICEQGYAGSYESFKYHCKTIKKETEVAHRDDSAQKENHAVDTVSRAGIFKCIWEGTELTPEHLTYILEHFPTVGKLDKCVHEFRDIFKHMSIPRLYCFIENYSNCGIKPIESFASGLLNDIEAVENAAGTPLSNGFVEGTNNKTKMQKRVMYGRCSLPLLRAKIILAGNR